MAGGNRGPGKKRQLAAQALSSKVIFTDFRKPKPGKSRVRIPVEGGDRKRNELPNPAALNPLEQALERQPSLDFAPTTKSCDEATKPSADPTTPSTSHRDEKALAGYSNPPHPDLWISFGCLRRLKHPPVSFPLQMRNDGSASHDILMGSDHRECKILVFGPSIGRYHCRLTLELGPQDDGPLRRQVVVKKILTPISPPSLITTASTLVVSAKAFEVGDEMVLSPGRILQLGDGDRYVYDAPEFASLYAEESEIYGGHNLNSTVMQVKRLSDKRLFVAKTIREPHIRMARTEIQVFKDLGHHPSIVQFIEAFFNFESKMHHLVLEAGSMDLYQYTLEKRSHAQDVLQTNAPQWIKEITSGIKYIHAHHIVHRDIKPQNILAFVKPGHVEVKIADMGLAKRNTQPVTEQASTQSSVPHSSAELIPMVVVCGDAILGCTRFLHGTIRGRQSRGLLRCREAAILFVDDTSVAEGEPGSPASLWMQEGVSRPLFQEAGRVPGGKSYRSRR
ncbi:Calcium/calmodulin-dependent protein kinase type IV [Tulasnella sp. 417]|nr:Calcium/calmodulin-dependent protein kinase type IV [Tulasnella sp. 417]